MTWLLDTHVLIWALEDNKQKMGTKIYDIITDINNVCYVSVVSLWEITIKESIGKLEVPDDIVSEIRNLGFKWLNLEPAHIIKLRNLPTYHKDPFNRILISQSKATSMQLLTLDENIKKYFL